jgi:uncharacterized membrane protein
MLSGLFWTLAVPAIAGGGLWIAALFVPSIAILLKAALDFLRSPLGLIVAVIAAGLFLFSSGWIAGDIRGSNTTRAEWNADNAAKLAAARREIAENKLRAAADADKRLADLDAYAKTLEQKVATYERENPSRDGMLLTADDIRRMLNGFR